MSVSIKQHFKHAPVQEEIEFKRMFGAVLVDMGVLRDEIVLIGTTLANYKTIYDAHTHLADGNAATVSLPDTSAATGTAGTASAFSDSSTAVAALTVIA